MPKTLRSPSGTGVPNVMSENDVTSLDPETPLDYVGRRQKRPRGDDCESSSQGSLKHELLAMLADWKKDQDQTLNRLCVDISELKAQNANIQTTSYELEKSMNFMSQQYEVIKNKLIDMEKQKKKDSEYIAVLENRLEDVEKRLKFAVIEIRNLPSPQVKQETQREQINIVQKTCEAVNVPVSESDIKNIYRLNNKSGASTIVTELTSVLTKNKILDGVKAFNKTNNKNKLSSSTIGLPGPSVAIYVTESLTNRGRKLFALARDATKTLDYKFCWTSNGRIFMRKAEGLSRIEVKEEADIEKLKRN
ncbi:hypothetical protein ABMA27_009760 [Loxostege sticticalis]|uniref:FP protein C-terminal domain-containing protein n=1 Tax=Loxostege sticticalis TaxID=481309 RepID=A0ABR3H6D6_LOXSC